MIIAEIGQNHCGDMDLAERLITLAKVNGADLVKFQLYDHKKLYGKYYEIPNVELSKANARDLFCYGTNIGIEVFFSVFDVERVAWCEEMGVKRYKIACGQGTNICLLVKIPKTSELIVSIPSNRYFDSLHKSIKRLYCIPEYPTKSERVHFNKVTFGSADYQYQGFSDHTIGLDAAKIAFARGAQIVEKHFALDHKTGIDAPWSMTPVELSELKRWENVCKEVL